MDYRVVVILVMKIAAILSFKSVLMCNKVTDYGLEKCGKIPECSRLQTINVTAVSASRSNCSRGSRCDACCTDNNMTFDHYLTVLTMQLCFRNSTCSPDVLNATTGLVNIEFTCVDKRSPTGVTTVTTTITPSGHISLSSGPVTVESQTSCSVYHVVIAVQSFTIANLLVAVTIMMFRIRRSLRQTESGSNVDEGQLG